MAVVSDRCPRTSECDVVREYIAAEAGWQEVADGPSIDQAADVAAREYVRAIDAYVGVLRANGRQIPHRMDQLAEILRLAYPDPPPLPKVA
jgi:hypothetical protein